MTNTQRRSLYVRRIAVGNWRTEVGSLVRHGWCRENLYRKQPTHSRRFCIGATLRVEYSNPIRRTLALAATVQFLSKRGRAALVEVRAQGGNFVRQDSVVFGGCMSHNERVKHAKPAREQDRCGHRKKENKPKGDGAALCARRHFSLCLELFFVQSSSNHRGRSRRGRKNLMCVKNITDAANGVDQFVLEWIVHLCAQAPHHHVNDVRFGLESDVPHIFCNLSARHHFTCRANQMREQQKFLRSKIERNARAHGPVMSHVHV